MSSEIIKYRYQIYDLSNKLLCDDNIVDVKYRQLIPSPSEGILISFDKKYYFNLASKNFIYKKIEDYEENYNKVVFQKDKFDSFKKELWHKICFEGNPVDDNIDIYIENGLDKLDPEVKDLVNIINKLPCVKTFLSCSGHGIRVLSVAMRVFSICVLEILNNIIYEYFKESFVITTNKIIFQGKIGEGFSVTLCSTKIGNEAYIKAKELAEKIEEYVTKDLDKDYETIIKNSNYHDNSNNDNDIFKAEVLQLKETLNNIKSVYVDVEFLKESENINQINLIFYEKSMLDIIMEVLWENFRNDFVLKTNKEIKYINNDTSNKGTCLTLEFVMPISKKADKIKALNEALLNKITDWK